MEIFVYEDIIKLFDDLGDKLVKAINDKPNIVLGLATGSTPVPLYHNLIRAYRKKQVSFKDVVTFNLDEYIDIDKYELSYHYFMKGQFYSHIDIKKKNRHIPKNFKETLGDEPERYETLIAQNPIDIQILGIGTNGHIGFNEPGVSFDSTTTIIDLSEETRIDNKRFFFNPDDVPTRAITMGIKTIMKAKEIILIATGDIKAEAIYKTIKGEVTNNVPASILQTHPNVKIYLDKKAAKLL